MKLTDITVRTLPCPHKGQRTYFDDALPSFGCRVSQGGTRSFVIQHGVDRQLITIGRYPIVSLANARGEAKRLLAERVLGKRRPRSIAWADALNLYLTECEDKNRPPTVHAYRRLITLHFSFGRRRLSEVTYEDLERRLQKLADVPSERNHALTAVKIFLNWAKKPPRRYIEYNPLEGLAPTKRPSRKHKLTSAELAAVYRTAIERADSFSCIVALLVLLGQRRTETAALRRSWTDTVHRTITFPGHITKNKQDHTLPYGPAVQKILQKLPTEDILFPASREHVRRKPCTHFNGWTKAKKEFDQRSGVTGWTLHDLRRNFGTGLAELGVPPHIVERLLNHKFGSIQNRTDGVVSAVAEIYNRHAYINEMRSAIALWERHLKRLAAPTQSPRYRQSINHGTRRNFAIEGTADGLPQLRRRATGVNH